MRNSTNLCWICGEQCPLQFPSRGDNFEIACPRCGPYLISQSLDSSKFPLPDSERYRLSFWSRQRQLEGRDRPVLHSHSIKAIIAELPNPRTSSKPDLLLVALSRLFPDVGQTLSVDWGRDFPLACARSSGEVKFHFRALKERGYIAGEGNAAITLPGWERIEHLEHDPGVSKNAFVAMPFTDDMLTVFRLAFAPAIEKAGFQPVLANDPQHNEKIDARILTEIKRSRFVVADSTGRNAGVYFEAGYAIGLPRPVIWTCRTENESDMHFDTRQYNHILWKSADDLREQLYYRIVATI